MVDTKPGGYAHENDVTPRTENAICDPDRGRAIRDFNPVPGLWNQPEDRLQVAREVLGLRERESRGHSARQVNDPAVSSLGGRLPNGAQSYCQ